MIFERKMHWQLFVNYPMVVDMLCQPEYFEENKRNPAPFVEMLCLLNFVEQLIVFVMPDRKSSHGYKEFCHILNKCSIEIVKPSDNLDLMLKQYEMYSALKVIPDFDKTKPEHQDVVLDVVSRLSLFNNVKTDMDEITNRKWYDILYEIMYNRFSNISQIRKYRKQLFVLESPLFVDEHYEITYHEYYTRLKKWYSSEKPSVDMKMDTAFTHIEKMESRLLSLRNAMNCITVSFKGNSNVIDYLESFAREIDNVPGFSALRMEFKNFYEVFEKNKGSLNRLYLINTLRTFNSLMPKDETMLSFASWYRRLTMILKSSFTITTDPNYANYVSLCNDIQQNTSRYINAISELYFYIFLPDNSIESIREMYYIYTTLPNDQYAKQYMKNLREREWDNLMGME